MKINVYNLLSYIYFTLILCMSFLGIKMSIWVFAAFFVISIPYIFNKIEHLLAIITLTSTIAYFFVGADEGIFSLYTIFAVVALVNTFVKKRTVFNGDFKVLFISILICLIAFISYNQSPFSYLKGFFGFVYVVLISIIVGNIAKFDYRVFFDILVKFSCIMTLFYFTMIPFTGVFFDGKLRIYPTVNSNTFGMSSAQLAVILFWGLFFSSSKGVYKIAKTISFLISLVLVLLSGSRSSLFAMVAAIFVMILFLSLKKEFIGIKAKRILCSLLFVAMVGVFVVWATQIDISRYNYIELIEDGGTNRNAIYAAVIPYILSKGYWRWGYGPGHECSRIVVTSLMNRGYTHTHNTFIEVFGELGVGGLILLIFFIIFAIKTTLKESKKVPERLAFLGLLLCLMINGMAEAYLCDIYLWILISLCTKVTHKAVS